MSIVHRMVQYQQQNAAGVLVNVVRVIDHNGVQYFVDEETDPVAPAEEKPLKVRLDHSWTIWNRSIQVVPCSYRKDCTVCAGYSERTRTQN